MIESSERVIVQARVAKLDPSEEATLFRSQLMHVLDTVRDSRARAGQPASPRSRLSHAIEPLMLSPLSQVRRMVGNEDEACCDEDVVLKVELLQLRRSLAETKLRLAELTAESFADKKALARQTTPSKWGLKY